VRATLQMIVAAVLLAVVAAVCAWGLGPILIGAAR
jgi:hypothetical protein